MTTSGAFSVRIFLPSGDPEGLRLVEKSNWTGQGLVFPRPLFGEARQRPELQRTGVYILWGPSEPRTLPVVYVGRGDPVVGRLESHARTKDFWTSAVAFTSKDQNLNNAHAQFLEAKLYAFALEARRCELDNDNQPQQTNLSEPETADASAFLADILLCLPLVGVTFFESSRITDRRASLLTLRGRGIEASGVDSPEGFVVKQNSRAAKEPVPSLVTYVKRLREALVAKGVLAAADGHLVLTQDYTFNSPSVAAEVFLGRPSNGRTAWKDASGRTLKRIQEAEASGP